MLLSSTLRLARTVCSRAALVSLASLLLLLSAFVPSAQAQVANSAALTAFPTFNGTVSAIAVSGTTIYVGGNFTSATNAPINGGNTVARSRLAAIDANTGALLPFNPNFNNRVLALIVNGGLGRLYVGGEFTMVDGNTRNLVCSFDVATNVLNAWNPIASVTGAVFGAYARNFALDGNNLYVAGQFSNINGSVRKHGCFFNGTGAGSLDPTFVPDMADNQTLGVAVSGTRAFFGGDFTGINGNTGYARFGSVDKATGALPGWTGYGTGAVHKFVIDGSFLYTCGTFTAPHPREKVNRQDLGMGGAMDAWNVNIANGSVWDLAPIGGGSMYVGGDFTLVNTSVTRNALAAFDNAGNVDLPFNPNLTGGGATVYALAVSGGVVYAGGDFTTVGGSARQGFAAFSSAPAITLGAAPASLYPMAKVTITGTNLNQPIGQVLFNGVPSPSIKLIDMNNIEAVVPYGATTGPITVNTGANSAVTGSSFTPLPTPQVTTIAGFGAAGYADGAGALAQFNYILGMVRVGNDLFLTEWVNNRIRRINLTTGLVTTFAGDGTNASLDGTGTSARFAQPVGICSDGTHLYVSEQGGSSRIRRIVIATGVVTTIAGNGNGFADGTGAGAQFDTPSQICYDAGTSSLYLSDRVNHRIRRITLGGVVTTLAGNGTPGALDGTGAGATFNLPGGICSDGTNLFVSEQGSHLIRKIVIATGVVTTIAGSVMGHLDGAGLSARFNAPGGIVLDAAGNLYVADTDNGRVRRISKATGMVTTVTGNGTLVTLDGIPSAAQIARPHGIWYDNASDQIYLGEISSANAVRKIDFYRYTYNTGNADVPGSWQRPGPVAALNFTNPASSFTVNSPSVASAVAGFTLGTSVEMLVKDGATLGLNNGVIMTNSGSLAIENGATGGRLLLTGTGALAGTSPVYGDAVVPNNATLESGGAAAKTLTAVELPSPMLAKFVVSNSVGTTTPAAPVIGVSGTVTVNSGGRLIIPAGGNLQHNNATALSFTVNNGGFLEIQDAGQISAAASPLNYVAGSTLQYSGTMPKTVNTLEFPLPLLANLTINNTGNVTLNAPKTLGASSIMTLTAGRLITSGFTLTVGNTAAAAVAATAGYVDGALQRTLPATSGVGTYLFPVGVGATSYPFAVINPTTGVTGPVLEVQAYTGNAGGTPTGTLSLLSTMEYWRMQQISGNYTSGIIFAQKAGLITGQAIGTNSNPLMNTGAYNGTISSLGAGLTTSTPISGVGHFLIGTGPATFVWNGTTSDWQVSTNWTPTRSPVAPTDVLQFNAGTWSPTNIPTQTIQQLIIGGNVTFAATPTQILTVGTGGVQIASGQSLNLSDNVTLTQNVGGTVQVDGTLNTANSFVNGAGAFTLAAGGTLATSRADGINGVALAQGAVQCSGTVSYTAGASYTFNSAPNAITTNFGAAGGKPAVTMPIGTLTTGGMNPISLNTPATVNVATNINGGGAFITGANTLTQGGSATLTVASGARLLVSALGSVFSGTSFTVQNMGTLEIQGNGLVTGASDVSYAAGSTLEYSGNAVKTINPREIGAAGVQNITISNAQPVTLGANALVLQNFIVNDGSSLVISSSASHTLTLNGAINLYTTGKFSSANGANAGSLVIGGIGSINAIRMDAANNTLNNFTMNRTGSFSVPNDLNVRGTLDLQNGILQPTPLATTRILSGDPTGSTPGMITGGNTGSYVQGKLQRRFMPNIAAAGTNYAFPIGTIGTGYRPATLANTLTGVMSPIVEIENYDAGATTFDMSLTSLLSPRNWRVQTMSGNFNGSAITLFEAGIALSNVVARSVAQAGPYLGFGGNSITTTVTSNAGAVPMNANHHFSIATITPTITSISPTTVSPGDTLSIMGTQLDGVLSLSIGGAPVASTVSVTPTLIRVVVGSGSSGLISAIYTGGVATSMVSVLFNNAPLITGFSPSYGTTSSTIQIFGQRLANPSNISFGGTNALSILNSNASSATVVIGNGSSGLVSVQNAGGVGLSASMFEFMLKPSIVNFFPKWAKAGDTVRIVGGNFQQLSGIQFGNSTFKQVFQPVTSGEVRILMPSDASTGLIRVENPVGQDSLGIMTAVKPPIISSVQPFPFVPVGQSITIRGTEFHPVPTVQIGTVSAATVEWTSLTEMKATFARATSGVLTVTASGGTVSMLVPMQVVPPPTITRFSPASPLPGETVTVTGATFLANLLSVRVNGLPAQNVLRQSDTVLSFTMPQTTGGPLVITSVGGSTTTTITFQPITVTAVSPPSAMIGQPILLTGTRFTGATAVRFGTVTTSQFTIVSPTQIRLGVPMGVTVGTIAVIGPAGVGTFEGMFTITVPSPMVTSVSPQLQFPGQTVTISGQNFTGTSSVAFGGVTTGQFTVLSPTQIRATVPPSASSGSVTVVNASGMASFMGFTVLMPAVNPNNALSSFPTFNGKVFAIAVNGNTVYVGGNFTRATNAPANGGNTVMQGYLAAIDATTGALMPLNVQPNNTVRCLAVGNGRVYAGGDFTMVNAAARKIVFSFDAANNALNAWNPATGAANGVVTSFSLSGTTLYCVGTFFQMNGETRKFSCAFDGTGTGSMLPFHGDVADNQTFAIAVNGNSAYIGGSFSGINGNINKKHFGSVDKITGNDAGWGNTKIENCCVEALSGLGSSVYVGGSFTNPRNRLLAFDASTGDLQSWNPNITDGSVLTLAESGGTVYAGGWFTKVNGMITRTRLAGFPAPPAAATVTSFNPNIADGAVFAVAVSGNILFAGGEFTTVDGQARQGFAAFNPSATPSAGNVPPALSTTAPRITSITPMSAPPMQAVTLTGVRFTGAVTVKFGGKTAWFKVNSDSVIQAVVPFGASSGDVSVGNATETGTLAGFTAQEAPRVSTVAGNGMGGLTNSAGQLASLNHPRFGTKIGDNLYFSSNHAIRKVNLQTGEVATVAGGLMSGSDNGVGEAATFADSYGIAPSDAGNGPGTTHLLVADNGSGRIRRVNIETGEVGNAIGRGRFRNPSGLIRTTKGPLVISDQGGHVVHLWFNNTLGVYAGFFDTPGSTNGSSETEALLNGPSGLAVDDNDYLYIADNRGNTIRKVWLEDGNVTTLAGTGEAGFADGAGNTAKFNSPMGLTLNGTTLYVADKNNQRIRAVDTRTGETVTVAGTGTAGFADGSLQSAQFTNPHSLVWDNENSALLVFDTDNHRIRRLALGDVAFTGVMGNTMMGMTNVPVVRPASMRILDISPLTVSEGSNVTLIGENISTLATFSLVTGTNAALPLEVISQSTSEVIVKIPNNIVPEIALSTTARFIVTTPTVRLTPLQRIEINALEVPFVSIITPNTGTTRSIVSVLGQNFAPLRASMRGSVRSVSIGGVAVQSFDVLSSNIIQVTVGTVRSGKVLVETLTGTLEAANTFTLDTTTAAAMMPPVMVEPIAFVASRDSIALNRLFAATQGMQWATTSNWTNGAPVVLRSGIRIREGRVVEIRLPSFGLVGSIPADVLQTLDKLEVLDLSNNRLSGTIPPMLANAQNLEVLNLQGNRFVGVLPSGFCSMEKMRELNLAGNSIEDSVSRLCCLTNATNINIEGNKFVGAMPPCVQNLRSLSVLNLQGNAASGALPEALGQLRNLTQMNLRGNRFTGAFPRALAQIFTNNPSGQKAKNASEAHEALGLELLDLGNNNLSGEIPEEIGNLLNLRTIRLDRNNFSGTLPKGLLSLNRLRTLDVSNNQFTSGPDLNTIRLDTLLVQNNRFSVVSLERFYPIRVLLRYLPQEFPQPRITARSGAVSFTTNSFTITVNEPLTLSVPRTENFSRTQWRKNGVALQTPLDTSIHAQLSLPAFTLADTGVYDCVVSNDLLPGIVLTSAQIQVRGTIPMIIPTAVRLIAPRANEEDLPTEPRFQWTSSRAADTYRFELAADTSFAVPLSTAQIPQSSEILAAEEVIATRISAAALFARGFPLQNDRRYAWRVRAENTFGSSAWAVGTFTTVPLNAELSIAPLDFGSVARRDTARGVVRISNFGSATLRLDSITTDNTAFVLDSLPEGTTLLPGRELLFRVSTPAEKIGNSVGGLTVHFRSGNSSMPQTRESANRLSVRVQAVKLSANPLDTVIVGRRALTTVLIQNLSDEIVTVRGAEMLNKVPDFALLPLERNLEIAPNQFQTVRIAITAQKEGALPEEILQIGTFRGDISTTLTRDRFDTVQISSRVFARQARPEDVFARIRLKAVVDSVAPGGAVALELLIEPQGTADFAKVLKAGTPSFAGTLRWNPNVLVLSQSERGLRRIRQDTSTALLRSTSSTQQFSLAPGLFWEGRSSLLLRFDCLSVSGNTDFTPLIIDNLQWGARTVFIDSLIPGEFTAKPCEAGGKRLVTNAQRTQLSLIAPNPAKDQISLTYTLREDGFVEIAMIDASGKSVQTLVSEEQTAGEYTITKGLKNIPSGSYTVRLSTQNGVVTKRLNVVR